MKFSIGQNRFPNHFPNPPRALYTTWYKTDLVRNYCISRLVHTFGTTDMSGMNEYTCDKNGCTCDGILCNLVTLTLPKSGDNDPQSTQPDCFIGNFFTFTAPGHTRMGYGDSDKADVQHQIVFTGVLSGTYKYTVTRPIPDLLESVNWANGPKFQNFAGPIIERNPVFYVTFCNIPKKSLVRD